MGHFLGLYFGAPEIHLPISLLHQWKHPSAQFSPGPWDEALRIIFLSGLLPAEPVDILLFPAALSPILLEANDLRN